MSEHEKDYFEANANDLTFGGAQPIIRKERRYIKAWRGKDPDVGITLSGGGIRSASFSLGILQALAYSGWLPKFDYMSTVSGGGYIGASLSYLLHSKWRAPSEKGAGCDDNCVDFDVSKENFPYLSYPMVGNNANVEETNWKGALLRRLRQNTSYLSPGESISLLSMLGVVLRNTIVSVGVHLGILALFFSVLLTLGLLGTNNLGYPDPGKNNWVFRLALAALGIYVLVSLAYVLLTIVIDAWITSRDPNFAYKRRRWCEKVYHHVLMISAALFTVAAVPWVHRFLGETIRILPDVFSDRTIWLSGASTVAGIIGSVWSFARTADTGKSRIPTGIIVTLACMALLAGLLLLSFSIALNHISGLIPLVWLLAGIILLGWLPNVNYVSVHRYYRDRLMEAFLPDVPSVLANPMSGKGRTESGNNAMLHELCGGGNNLERVRPEVGPYHIINCNVVLVSSSNPKYRGRGGDNFILSPLFIGSNATGWRKTPAEPGNCITLATAMAISGAAVNPDTGCGGEGITRKPVLSVLMSLLNIRLGYWMSNPAPSPRQSHWPVALKKIKDLLIKPNLIYPGMWETFDRMNLHEKADYLLVSDGGHFENLGLYELVRRRLKLIVVCDGAADPKFTFSDLANAIEKVRSDFGVIIDVRTDDLEVLKTGRNTAVKERPGVKTLAERGYLTASIIYPADGGPNPEPCGGKSECGLLIYLTTTFFPGLSADLGSYREKHPQFPDEPTSDQFFDEKQFEAYRELGYQTAWAMMADISEKYLKNAGQPSEWREILSACFRGLEVRKSGNNFGSS
jgi:hypothetical protein